MENYSVPDGTGIGHDPLDLDALLKEAG